MTSVTMELKFIRTTKVWRKLVFTEVFLYDSRQFYCPFKTQEIRKYSVFQMSPAPASSPSSSFHSQFLWNYVPDGASEREKEKNEWCDLQSRKNEAHLLRFQWLRRKTRIVFGGERKRATCKLCKFSFLWLKSMLVKKTHHVPIWKFNKNVTQQRSDAAGYAYYSKNIYFWFWSHYSSGVGQFFFFIYIISKAYTQINWWRLIHVRLA